MMSFDPAIRNLFVLQKEKPYSLVLIFLINKSVAFFRPRWVDQKRKTLSGVMMSVNA